MKSETQKTYRYRLLQVQLYIQENLDSELTLDELARYAHFSPYHFHRIFRGFVGESVAEYTRRLRMEAAASMLWTTKKSVTEIGLDVGYQTTEAFSRAFRKHYGASPSDFRANHLEELIVKELPGMNETVDTYPVEVKSLPNRHVAFLRHTGPYDEAGPTFGKFLQWAGQNNMFREETVTLGICHDDPDVTEGSKIRFDCCITVDESFSGDGEIQTQELEGGKYAVLRYTGPYTEMGPVYRWFFGVWMPNAEVEPRNLPAYEIYQNDPENTPPEELVTDICVPIAE